MEAVELKKGTVIKISGLSHLILRVDTDFDEIYLKTNPITCNKCGGNLEKLGRVKGQYKCVECNSPIFLKENGELEK